MRAARNLLVAFFVMITAVIEVVWFSPLGLPGATPPLTLILVLALALRRTPGHSALIGFYAGLIVDLVPPSTTPMGVSAFAFTLMAFLMSSARPLMEGTVGLPLMGVAFSAIAVEIIRIALGAIVGYTEALSFGFIVNLLTNALYALILATIVLPLTMWFDNKLTPRQSAIFR